MSFATIIDGFINLLERGEMRVREAVDRTEDMVHERIEQAKHHIMLSVVEVLMYVLGGVLVLLAIGIYLARWLPAELIILVGGILFLDIALIVRSKNKRRR